MGYGSSVITSVELTIPPGYQVKEPMATRSIKLPNDVVSYFQGMQIDSTVIHFRADFRINKSEIEARLYPRIRDFYSLMISYQNEQVVLEPVKSAPQKAVGKKSK